MKNVAILIPSLKPGGAEKQAALLAMVLDRHCSVDLYLLYGDIESSQENLNVLSGTNVRLHFLRGSLLSKVRQLRDGLKGHNTSVLFNYLTSCDVLGAIAGRLARVQSVYGGVRNARVEWWKMVAERITHNLVASGTVYNCYSGAEYFTSKGFDRKKNVVIPNCFLDMSEPIVRENRAIKHIVTVGRFVPQKDYKTIIQTIARLRTMREDFVMDIVGYGEEEQKIRGWIEDFGVGNCVNIYIRPDNVQEIVRNADIYLSTSLFEGTSNSIMEALNWSLPVVATNVGDNEYLIVNGENGYLHSIGDVESLSQSLALLLDSVELRNEFGAKGNNILRENHSMEKFEARYLQLINSTVK